MALVVLQSQTFGYLLNQDLFAYTLLDLDQRSRDMLQSALTGWEIEVINGATSGSLFQDGSPIAADFLIVQAGIASTEPLALCRGLRQQAGRNLIPLLATSCDQANTELLAG